MLGLVSKFVTLRPRAGFIVPVALAIGVDPGIHRGFSTARHGYYILPTYPSDLQ
ncbi:hypothetical protein ACNKHL_24680 [Shigella flexneri]